jgi:hypothetical protein
VIREKGRRGEGERGRKGEREKDLILPLRNSDVL